MNVVLATYFMCDYYPNLDPLRDWRVQHENWDPHTVVDRDRGSAAASW